MRVLCTWLSGTVLVCALACLAPGCDGGSSDLEKTPDVTKQVNPETDMPGLKEQQDKLKKDGKAPKS